MAIVLCTGIHPALMQTRKLILQNAGHSVFTAETETEIKTACEDYVFEVAVIGQSADGKLKREWLTLIRRHCPTIKVLEVYMPSAGIALMDADDWLESPVIPERLAERVATLAARRKAANR